MEVIGGLVAPLVFKTSVGLNKVPGRFDSYSPPYRTLAWRGFFHLPGAVLLVAGLDFGGGQGAAVEDQVVEQADERFVG